VRGLGVLLVAALLWSACAPPTRAEAPGAGADPVAVAEAEARRDFLAGRIEAAVGRLKPLLRDRTLARASRFSAGYRLSRLIERAGRVDLLPAVDDDLIALDKEGPAPLRPLGALIGHNIAQIHLAAQQPDEAFAASSAWLNLLSPIEPDADMAGLYPALAADASKALALLGRQEDAEFILERGIAALAMNGAAGPADVDAFVEAVGLHRLGIGLAQDARRLFGGLYRAAERTLPATAPDRVRLALWNGYALADAGAPGDSLARLETVVGAVRANPVLPAGWRDLAILLSAFDHVALERFDDAARELAEVARSEIALYRGLGEMLATEMRLLRGGDGLRPQLADISRRLQGTAGPDSARAAYGLYIAALAEDRAGHGEETLRLLGAMLARLGDQDRKQAEAGATHVVPPTAVERRMLEQALRLIAGDVGPAAARLDGERARLAFDIVQRLARHRAALGVSAAAFRSATDSALDQEQLRAAELLDGRRRALIDELVQTIAERARRGPADPLSPRERLRPIAQLAIYHDTLLKLRASLAKRLPDYLAKTRFAHVGFDAFRAALNGDEAAVLLVSHGDGILSACVRGDGLWLARGVTPKRDIVAAIERVRRSLTTSDGAFDGGSAHRLYAALFGAVAPCLAGASHVIQVLDADLLLLPTAVLLTGPDDGATPATAPWFVRDHAVSLLPSAASLVLLRSARPPSAAHQAFLGFGDPALNPTERPGRVVDLSGLYATRGGANLAELRQLGNLPETAGELRALSTTLGDGGRHVHLGAAATEAALRREPLADYRIIAFATHGLLAREIDGLSEPAIVLTPGDGRNRLDDGLLTTTDIAELQLDADLVILSACNTAGGDGRGDARGLTGLANAFFGAGARSLIATQWSVDSAASRDMMIGLIGAAARPDGAGIAYALRDAMLKMIAASGPSSQPRFWAPFIVAGDGRALARATLTARVAMRPRFEPLWQIVEGGPRFDEAVQIETAPDGTLTVSGIDGLGAGAQRAGTFRWRIAPEGRVLSRRSVADIVFARGAVPLAGGDVVRLGTTFSAERKTDVVVYRERPDGTRAWSAAESSPLHETPGALLRTPRGTILAVLTRNLFTETEGGSPAVVLLELDEAGRLVERREIPLPLCPIKERDCAQWRDTPLGYEPTAAFVAGAYFGGDGQLRLILDVEGRHRPAATDPRDPDPVSGRHPRCGLAVRTAVWELDDERTRVENVTLHEDLWIESAAAAPDGTIWLAGSRYRSCAAEGDVFAAALDPPGALGRVTADGTALNEAATAVALSPRGDILVAGRATVPLEIARVAAPAADDPGAERGETVASEGAALLLLYDRSGTPLASLAVPGRRLIRIRDVRFLDDERIVIAGSIDGGQIWISGYRIERPAR